MKPPTLSPLAYRRLCLVAVVALAAIVVTGGAVRLTGSGLGCSTWPQCEPGSYTSAIAFRPLVEFGNRMVTIAVGVITAAVAGGSLLLRPRRRDLVWLAWGLVLGYVAQAVLGGLTVLYKLSPLLVMGHFLVCPCCCSGPPSCCPAAPASGLARDRVLWWARSCAGWPARRCSTMASQSSSMDTRK